MLRLSIRKGESTWRFGAPQWGIVDGPDLTATQAAAQLAGRKVCTLLHGYNVSQPDDAYARIASHIGESYDELIAVHMPLSKWTAAFWLARLRTGRAGQLLADALGALSPDSLDIEGHSLGCMVALESLLYGLRCRNLILAGAAVDNEALALDEKYGWAAANARRILVAYSAHDDVLAKAGRVGLFDVPLGLRGLEAGRRYLPHIAALDCSASVHKHSGYKSDNATFFPAWRAIA